jgi:hypothetical protein
MHGKGDTCSIAMQAETMNTGGTAMTWFIPLLLICDAAVTLNIEFKVQVPLLISMRILKSTIPGRPSSDSE